LFKKHCVVFVTGVARHFDAGREPKMENVMTLYRWRNYDDVTEMTSWFF